MKGGGEIEDNERELIVYIVSTWRNILKRKELPEPNRKLGNYLKGCDKIREEIKEINKEINKQALINMEEMINQILKSMNVYDDTIDMIETKILTESLNPDNYR